MNCKISEIIQRKDDIDVIMLMRKYSEQIKAEIRENEEFEKMKQK